MKSILICFQLLFISISLMGYPYVKDVLYYKGDTLIVYQIPLENRLKKVIETEAINARECSTMKCDEGYRKWELRNDSLFLKNIVNCCGDESINENSQDLLSATYQEKKVFAHWLNSAIYNQYGTLIANIAERLIYEFDREFIIEGGILKEIISYDNRQSGKSIYFEKPDTLNKFLSQVINWDLLEKNQCDFNKTMVVNFRVNQNKKAEDVKVLRGQNEACDFEIKRAVESIPACSLYFKKGKPIDMRWNLPIKLDKISLYKSR